MFIIDCKTFTCLSIKQLSNVHSGMKDVLISFRVTRSEGKSILQIIVHRYKYGTYQSQCKGTFKKCSVPFLEVKFKWNLNLKNQCKIYHISFIAQNCVVAKEISYLVAQLSLLDCLVLIRLSNLSKRETTRICSGNVFLSLFSRIQLEVHALKYPTIGMFGHTGQLTLAE